MDTFDLLMAFLLVSLVVAVVVRVVDGERRRSAEWTRRDSVGLEDERGTVPGAGETGDRANPLIGT